jgi:hypothetical protein
MNYFSDYQRQVGVPANVRLGKRNKRLRRKVFTRGRDEKGKDAAISISHKLGLRVSSLSVEGSPTAGGEIVPGTAG